jgi:hypothetical protein
MVNKSWILGCPGIAIALVEAGIAGINEKLQALELA